MYAMISMAVVLSGCGGGGYTTDKDEALALLEEIAKEEKGLYKEMLEYVKDVKNKRDDILKEYDKDEGKLMEKAKKGDKDALSDLKKLRNLEINAQSEMEDMERSLNKKRRAFHMSYRDIYALNEADDLESWDEKIQKVNEKRREAEREFNEDLSELRKDK